VTGLVMNKCELPNRFGLQRIPHHDTHEAIKRLRLLSGRRRCELVPPFASSRIDGIAFSVFSAWSNDRIDTTIWRA
jgi:hypothetical protein